MGESFINLPLFMYFDTTEFNPIENCSTNLERGGAKRGKREGKAISIKMQEMVKKSKKKIETLGGE